MLLVPEDIAAEVLFRHGQQNHIAYMAFPGTHIMGLFGTKGTKHGRFALRERTDTRTDDLLKQAVDSMRPVICRLSDVTGIPNAIPIYIVSNEENYYGASAIFHPAVQEKLKELFPDGYWLIPSSRHEFLAVPKYDDPQLLQGLTELNADMNKNVLMRNCRNTKSGSKNKSRGAYVVLTTSAPVFCTIKKTETCRITIQTTCSCLFTG